MSFPQTIISTHSTPPRNSIGTAFFLSYILVAVYLTHTIVATLYAQYTLVFPRVFSPASKNGTQNPGVQGRNRRKRHVKMYALVALLSFSSLTWDMLGFLISSFLSWSKNHGSQGNIVSVWSARGALQGLGRWMLDSELFDAFAGDLVAGRECAVVTQSVLGGYWVWGLWMAGRAERYGFSAQTMVPYVILSQTLPMSFTAALFVIKLHLSASDDDSDPRSVQSKGRHQETQPQTQTQTQTQKKALASPLLPTLLLNALLMLHPHLRSHSSFIPVLLLERAVLVLPHTGLLRLRGAEVRRCAAVSVGCVVASWGMGMRDLRLGGVLGRLWDGGWAVRTMGWDGVVSVVLWRVLRWGGGV